MPLLLDIAGATDEQRARGVDAASVVFAAGGVTPHDAAAGQFRRSSWDDMGFSKAHKPSAEEMRAAAVWDKAEQAAIKTCCEGWAKVPTDAYLVYEDQEGDHWRYLFAVRLIQLHCGGTTVTGDWHQIAAELWSTHHHLDPAAAAEAYLRRANDKD